MSNFDVYIGIDFGTSFSKVCFNINGDLYVYNKNNSSFIPTKIYYSKDIEKVYINNDKSYPYLIPIKYFKYSMAFEPIINEDIINNLPKNLSYKQLNVLFSIYFLSCLIKEVKNEIINKYKKQENDIKWEINMSAPINDYQGEIYDLYYNVLNSAYLLADESQLDSFDIYKINEIYNNYKNNISNKFDILSIHPELFIEAVYLTDNNKFGLNYGSYMIMDIGGGTVDIGILWKRKWENEDKYDLVVINILKYGVEINKNELLKNGITKDNAINILVNGYYYQNRELRDYFLKNIKSMIKFESGVGRIGIDDIKKKRIYYTGGGCKLKWYKNIVNLIQGGNIFNEDKIPINKKPLNYNNGKNDLHRLIIAIELAKPVEAIKYNFGSTIIINEENFIPKNITRPVQEQYSKIDLDEIQKEKYSG